MTNIMDQADVVTEFSLDESIDISTINQFYDQLRNLLNSTGPLVVDAGNVKRLDTSAFQLLCSWYREAHSKGIDVRWKNIDGIFFNSAKLLGVTKHLALE